MEQDRPVDPTKTDLDKIRGVALLFSRLRLTKSIISWALAAIYTWLQLRNLPYPEIINGSNPTIALQLALIVMYLCWVGGLTIDFTTEARVFATDPNRGKVPFSFYQNSFFLFAAAVVLLWARKNDELFTAALTIFSIVCLWTLLAGRRGLQDIIDDSKKTYEAHADWIGKEQLDFVEYYVAGKWVWIRQACLLVLLAGVDVVCWVDAVSKNIAGWIHIWDPEINKEAVIGLVPLSAIILFLVAAEGSQWYMRVKTRLSVAALRLLKEKEYRVVKKGVGTS